MKANQTALTLSPSTFRRDAAAFCMAAAAFSPSVMIAEGEKAVTGTRKASAVTLKAIPAHPKEVVAVLKANAGEARAGATAKKALALLLQATMNRQEVGAWL